MIHRLTAVLILLGICKAFPVYDCGQAKIIQTYRRDINSDCKQNIVHADKLTEMEGTIVQIPFQYKIPAQTLTVRRRSKEIYCNIWGNNINKIIADNYAPFKNTILSAAIAKHSINIRRLQLQHVTIDLEEDATEIIIDSTDIDEHGFCKNRRETITLDIYEVSLKRSEVSIELKSDGGIIAYKLYEDYISIEDTDCGYLLDGTFVLFNPRDIRHCPMEILHSGVMNTFSQHTKNYLIDTESGFSFEIKKKTKLCRLQVETTNDKRIYIIPGIHEKENTTLYAPSDASWRTFILSAAQFVSVQTTKNLNSLKHAVLTAECIILDQLTERLIQDAAIEPSEVAFKLTGIKGTTVITAGTAVHIASCKPMEAKLRAVEKCTTEIPIHIVDTNTSAYMDARTYNIFDSSTTIPCTDISVPIFHIRDKWYKMTPYIHEIQMINKLFPKQIKMDDFNVTTIKGLYSHEMTDKIEPSNAMHTLRHTVKAATHIKLIGNHPKDYGARNQESNTSQWIPETPYLGISLDMIAIIWCGILTIYIISKEVKQGNRTNIELKVQASANTNDEETPDA